MPNSKTLTGQFTYFYFHLGSVTSTDPLLEEKMEGQYDVWSKVYDQVEEAQRAHPLRVAHVKEGGMDLELERWEYLGKDGYTEEFNGEMAWPIAFFSHNELAPEVLKELYEMCSAAFTQQAAAAGLTVRFAQAVAHREYRVKENTILQL